MKNLLISILIAGGIAVSQAPQVAGEYRTISESEWEMFLSLGKDGTGTLTSEKWLAGKPETKESQKYIVKWEANNTKVIISIAGKQDIFQFQEDVPLDNFGLDEKGDELVPVIGGSEKGNSILGGNIFIRRKSPRK